jgi:hypothetical protein
VQQRRAELIAETEAELLDRCQAESERIEQLNRGLHEITEEANRKAVALLREFDDLAGGGRWKGVRSLTPLSRYPGMEAYRGLEGLKG